ncbi:DUF4255 domain-containing protein [Solimicrobium silvestre]|uniref:Pvc16 N-terminal domain-containing protein n=1 Tax=Solimicrobium silvestre TaxID=2099400 RepID=A0A2S9H0G6_9BURK|nr:DUF4255 domain-containing protein [Solimicrobium silvestre]PRC93440.1 hypothetical protein S2091_1827 [Solimicrobium silvestre]
MINAAISHLANQLNQQFKNNFQLVEDIVVVSNLVESDGSPAINANNKLALTLVNIEKDSMPYRPNQTSRGRDDRQLVHSSPLYLNLYLMMSANFGSGNYKEALKTISQAIGFFQQQAVFDQQNSPGLDPRIEKLILDMENLKIPDLNNLWSLIGGRYMPSAFYKVRMITVDAGAIIGQVPVITDPRNDLIR